MKEQKNRRNIIWSNNLAFPNEMVFIKPGILSHQGNSRPEPRGWSSWRWVPITPVDRSQSYSRLTNVTELTWCPKSLTKIKFGALGQSSVTSLILPKTQFLMGNKQNQKICSKLSSQKNFCNTPTPCIVGWIWGKLIKIHYF